MTSSCRAITTKAQTDSLLENSVRATMKLSSTLEKGLEFLGITTESLDFETDAHLSSQNREQIQQALTN